MARVRKHRNKISIVDDLSGNSFSTPEGVNDCYLNFFSSLWSYSSSKTIHQTLFAFPRYLPALDGDDMETLSKLVTKQEVKWAIRAMPRGKSPIPDGLYVDLYVFYWHLIGDHLFKAVSHFFNFCKLPNSWGRTYITLIPKTNNTCRVNEFWPILFYNVSYKIITKFFDSRLKLDIHKLLSQEQSGFIPGLSPFNNILEV